MDSIILSVRKAEEESGRPKALIVAGDFFQLGGVLPAGSPHRCLLESFSGTDHQNWYAFMGKYLDECDFRTVSLNEPLRQKTIPQPALGFRKA